MDLKKKKTTYIYCYGNNFDILNKWFGIGKLHIDNMDYIISINGHSYNIYKGDKKFFLQEIKEVKIRIKNKLENDKNYNINKDDENKDSESEDDEYVDENEDYKNNNYMNEVY
ncbi:hypothetical protein F8M41_002041 [Gigaspora margarita]|uniref:Uncharacterized protein n=1 Tax=Gigaspora margarita TaxID=4874 RepID=A0A8H4A8S6_GIGMA|nr:hypothetical protein F8M41_002041 [Gigaspora margarita]